MIFTPTYRVLLVLLLRRQNIMKNRIESDFKSEEENCIFMNRLKQRYRRNYGAALNVAILYYLQDKDLVKNISIIIIYFSGYKITKR